MQKLLVPLLVLTGAALSASNVLPIVSMNEMNTGPLSYPDNDNTYSSKHQIRNKLNAILFNVNVDPENEKTPQTSYVDNNEDFDSKDDNYNVKGFRKEQWHNYPRQLDRLNRYFYQHQSADKRNLDPDDPGSFDAEEVSEPERLNDISEEYVPAYGNGPRTADNEAEIAEAVINPLLIFRIHLACYNNNKAVQPTLESMDLGRDRHDESNKEEIIFSNEINPVSNLIKVKREGKINLEDEAAHESSEKRKVNKRIFALFSRLQSLNPKGHQLHHRRHMYALYGPPDGEGGGVLTAETRATFMRPPGSPLRWG